MGEHWNIDSRWIGAKQLMHELEKAWEKGSGTQKLSRAENVVT